jgi:hypothetical protein
MTISISSMTLFELRAYLVWLERTKADFCNKNPKPKKDSPQKITIEWYNSQITSVNGYIKMQEGHDIRKALDAEAKKFLYPQARRVTQVPPRGFGKVTHAIKQFGRDFWAAFSH